MFSRDGHLCLLSTIYRNTFKESFFRIFKKTTIIKWKNVYSLLGSKTFFEVSCAQNFISIRFFLRELSSKQTVEGIHKSIVKDFCIFNKVRTENS
jgi:hypothetical protein